MADLPVSKIDPLEDSKSHLLAMAFVKGNSPFYELAVNVARGAAKYEAFTTGKVVTHLVAFAKSKADAARALSLLRYVASWRGVQVYAGGKLVQAVHASYEILDCYVTSLACDDWRAHCYTIVDDPSRSLARGVNYTISIRFDERPEDKPKRADRYVFPCTLLHPYFRFQLDHPSTFKDQIQAASVRRGCDWCPNFKADNFALSEVQQGAD